MAIATRRSLSWIATLAVIFGLCAGYAHLPGAGGLTAELRWLLRDCATGPPPRAANLLATQAALTKPDEMSSALNELLHDEGEFVTRGAVLLWSDLMRLRDLRRELATAQIARALVAANDRLPPALRVFALQGGGAREPLDEIWQWIDQEQRRESGGATSQPSARDG